MRERPQPRAVPCEHETEPDSKWIRLCHPQVGRPYRECFKCFEILDNA